MSNILPALVADGSLMSIIEEIAREWDKQGAIEIGDLKFQKGLYAEKMDVYTARLAAIRRKRNAINKAVTLLKAGYTPIASGHDWLMPSESGSGTTYRVSFDLHWACSCPASDQSGEGDITCKHMAIACLVEAAWDEQQRTGADADEGPLPFEMDAAERARAMDEMAELF